MQLVLYAFWEILCYVNRRWSFHVIGCIADWRAGNPTATKTQLIEYLHYNLDEFYDIIIIIMHEICGCGKCSATQYQVYNTYDHVVVTKSLIRSYTRTPAIHVRRVSVLSLLTQFFTIIYYSKHWLCWLQNACGWSVLSCERNTRDNYK